MRIGEFAENNNLSIDTIRYYVDLNLIHPIHRGRYFYFEKEQQEELDRLLYLKSLKFSLDEIKKILTAESLSKIKTSVENSIYEDMLHKKREEISREIKGLSAVLKGIEDEILKFKNRHDDTYKERGVSFSNLQILCCPRCGRAVEISDGILKGNGIYEGISNCECGYSLSINQGIIITKQNIGNIIEPYEEGRDYVGDLINETPKSYVDYMMSSSKEVIRLLLDKGLSEKTLLFMNSGLGVLETNLLGHSTDIKLMILADGDFNKLKVAKKSIESNFPGCNVVYICSELYELPLRKKAIDIAVDFLAAFLNGFRMDKNIYEYILPLLKSKSSIVGLYMYFKQFRMLSRLPEPHRYIFDGRSIPKAIKEQGFAEIGGYEEYVLNEGSNIDGFFREGDTVHSKIIVFDRKG